MKAKSIQDWQCSVMIWKSLCNLERKLLRRASLQKSCGEQNIAHCKSLFDKPEQVRISSTIMYPQLCTFMCKVILGVTKSTELPACLPGLTLCNPTDCSSSGSSLLGIFLARIPEWVDIFSSRRSLWPRDQNCVSCVSCIGKWILYHWATWRALKVTR